MDTEMNLEQTKALVLFKCLDVPSSAKYVMVQPNGHVWMCSEKPELFAEGSYPHWSKTFGKYRKGNMCRPVPSYTEDGNLIEIPEGVDWKTLVFEI